MAKKFSTTLAGSNLEAPTATVGVEFATRIVKCGTQGVRLFFCYHGIQDILSWRYMDSYG